jgi:hypothetical protein
MRTVGAVDRGTTRTGDETGAPGRRAPAGLLGVDVLAVLLFAAIGRRSHAEGLALGGLASTAWPFLVGTATGWAVARAWRRPASASTGMVVWTGTLVLGMLLRRLTGDGLAWPFVVVATVVLGALLLGWRAVAHVVRTWAARP